MSPQQRGYQDEFCKKNKRADGTLNIRFSQNNQDQKNITNKNG